MALRLLYIISFLLCGQVIWSQTRAERKQIKKEQQEKAYQKSRALIESGNYQFEATWAAPLDLDVITIGNRFTGGGNVFQGGRINLIGNTNYVKVLASKNANVYMPFFGREFFPSYQSPNSNSIVFKGAFKAYRVKHKDRKQQSIIKFSAKIKNDVLDGLLIVNSDLTATLNLSSTSKQSIRYTGIVKELQENLSN